MNLRRFAFGMFAIVLAALACRQGQPAQDPKPAPNSPLPSVDRPEKDDSTTPGPKSPLSRDGG
jgi:hypothetical protein